MSNTSRPIASASPEFNFRTVQPNDEFWVVNQTREKTSQPGVVVFNITTDGEQKSVKVENTWVPQDLSVQALATDIARSIDFRNVVRLGILKAVSAEEAASILKQQNAINELRRLEELRGGRLKAEDTSPITVENGSVVRADANSRPGTPAQRSMAMEVVARLRAGEITEKQAADSIIGLQFILNDAEKREVKSMNNLPPIVSDAVNQL